MEELEARVERLLDQLENPNLTDREIEQLQRKIDYLSSLKQ